MSLPIILRVHPGFSLEEAGERGRFAETQEITDLLNAIVLTRIKQRFCAEGEIGGNP